MRPRLCKDNKVDCLCILCYILLADSELSKSSDSEALHPSEKIRRTQ
jgi:hypothetical protein